MTKKNGVTMRKPHKKTKKAGLTVLVRFNMSPQMLADITNQQTDSQSFADVLRALLTQALQARQAISGTTEHPHA